MSDMPTNIALDAEPTDPTGGGASVSGTGSGTTGAAGQTTQMQLEKFVIPDVVLNQQMPLVELILATESMNDEERQYWFHILPIMSEEQVEKLRGILVTEQRKLAELNQNYNAHVTEINEKYLHEWEQKKQAQRKEALVKAEAEAQEQELTQEENLLEQLNQV